LSAVIDIGIGYDGRSPLREAMDIAARALDAGATRIWMAEHLGFRQTFVGCSAFALRFPTATVVPTALSPYALHPMVVAMGLATLAEIAPGRVAVALGVGSPGYLKESGMTMAKPIRAMREYVECINALWAGGRVTYQGEFFTLDDALLSLKPEPEVPVYIAAMGEQMLRLTGRIGDGVVLSVGLTPEYSRIMLDTTDQGAAKIGRDLSGFRRSSYIYCAISLDGRQAVEAVRPAIAYLFRNQMYEKIIGHAGLPLDHEALMHAVAHGKLEEARALVSDDVVEAFAIVGTPQRARDRLQAYLDVGISEPVLNILGDESSWGLACDLIKEFAG